MLLERLFFGKFFALFNADRISIIEASDGRIRATVGWPDEGQPYYDADEETQDVLWACGDIPGLWDMSLVLELLAKLKLVRGDRIEAEQSELVQFILGEFAWTEGRANEAISGLLSVRMEMIDDEVPGDEFFLHF